MSTVISTQTNLRAVQSEKWEKMSVNELLDQKSIMFNRYEFLLTSENPEQAKQILNGINRLENLIQERIK